MIRIRRCEPEDIRELCGELVCYHNGESTWEPDGTYWAAYDRVYLPGDGGYFSERIVGYGGYVQSQRFRNAVFFHSAGVDPSARGNHLQRRLIRARLRGAKKAGYDWAVTYTLCDNPASARSLIACGFKPHWPSNPWAGYACYWHRKLDVIVSL